MKVNLEKGYNGFMRYHDITKDDMLNGDGLRVVLWVAGCSHHCDYLGSGRRSTV